MSKGRKEPSKICMRRIEKNEPSVAFESVVKKYGYNGARKYGSFGSLSVLICSTNSI